MLADHLHGHRTVAHACLQVDLAKASSGKIRLNQTASKLAIDAGSQIFWNGEAVICRTTATASRRPARNNLNPNCTSAPEQHGNL
ncbi:MAG: hypothetical protein IPL58_01850 [Betaproteobacteria bacterium]|uniref:Uncharacterized protein n=1 Tax=Candidatus Proximibacter danicus TaxID=2954365 RepID=A0A9D7K1D8_9PROT|nr:hypothetical protein [Candidatus Proximibacter danicus]